MARASGMVTAPVSCHATRTPASRSRVIQKGKSDPRIGGVALKLNRRELNRREDDASSEVGWDAAGRRAEDLTRENPPKKHQKNHERMRSFQRNAVAKVGFSESEAAGGHHEDGRALPGNQSTCLCQTKRLVLEVGLSKQRRSRPSRSNKRNRGRLC